MDPGTVSTAGLVAPAQPASISEDERPPTTARPAPRSVTLTPELMGEAAWRLGWLGLIYAGGIVVGHFRRRLLLLSTRSVPLRFHVADAVALAAATMGLAIYFVSRSGRLRPRQLRDLGLAFNVLGALGIGSAYVTSHEALPNSSLPLVSAECVWIIIYPLVVPNAPRRILIASLAAASMAPMALALSAGLGHASIGGPITLVSFFLPNYTIAVMAYLVARIVHHLNVRLKNAREIGSYELMIESARAAWARCGGRATACSRVRQH